MKGEVKRQSSFFAEPIYAVVIPKNHMLRRLLELVDWNGLAERVADCYADEGRPSWPPEQMIKIVVLQYLYDRSDRQMEEDLRYHLAFKFFLGLAADEVGPDNATISRFRSRLGEERFRELFNAVVAAARAHRLVGDRLHAVDATAVEAKVNEWRWRDRDGCPPAAGGGDGFRKWEGPRLGRGPDRDACFGYKSKTKPFHGYKAHVAVDVDAQIVVGVVTTPGNESDGELLEAVLDRRARSVVADKAYDTPANHRLLKEEKIEDRIIRHKRGKAAESTAGGSRERSVVERVNAWLKRWCGGGRARYWGLEKVGMQILLSATALNLKRLVCLTSAP